MRAKLCVIIIMSLMVIPALLFAESTSTLMKSEPSDKKSVFNIQSQIYIDGSLVSSPRIIVQAGKTASVSFSNKENSSCRIICMPD